MADTLRAAARAAYEQGRPAVARDLLVQLCHERGEARDWLTLCQLQSELNQPDAARTALNNAFRLAPDDPVIARTQAGALRVAGEDAAAFGVLKDANAQHPDDAELATDLALMYELRGDAAQALAYYTAALENEPRAERARLNRAAILRDGGSFAAALADYETLPPASSLYAAATLGRAECLRQLHRYADAITVCDAILADDAGNLRAALCKAVALAADYQLAPAQALLDRVWTQDPNAVRGYAGAGASITRTPDARALYLMAAHGRLCDAAWDDMDLVTARCNAIYADAATAPGDLDLAYPAMYLPLTPAAACAAHVAVTREVVAAPLQRAASRTTDGGRRIRLAYLRSTFRDHPSSYLNGALYACHDRTRFEVIAYATNPEDGSDIRARLRRGFDAFHDVSRLNDADLAERIYADGIDVLVDGDGYSDDARPAVLAARPAPIQVGYFGHMHSLYVPWIDYRLTAHGAEPAAWPRPLLEKRAFIPGSFYTYDTRDVWPLQATTRAQHGLPDDAFVLCAFGRVNKICPQVFGLWVDVLRAVPSAVLWLSAAPPQATNNLRRHAAAGGITPERLLFAPALPHVEHVARHQLADIFLDTLRFNAHTTALDALHAGLPCVSYPGATWAGRLCASFLATLALPELIADSPAGYRDIVIRLAREPALLGDLRDRLQSRMQGENPFATATVAGHFDEAFATMWQRHCQGQPPIDLDIGSRDGSHRPD